MNEKISVIIPCYNGEKFIDRCFESVNSQDYPAIEVVAVDDGSTDGSLLLLKEWEDRFSEKGWTFKCCHQENQGPAGAICTGLKQISGDFLILLDIDDEFLPGALAEKARYLSEHGEIDAVRSNGMMVVGGGSFPFCCTQEEKCCDDVFTAIIQGKTNNWAGSYMVRTNALFSFYPDREIYRSRYGQNLQILLPVVYKKKCGFIDRPHMNYNRQPNSLSNTDNKCEREKKNLDNYAGFRAIRIHMVNAIERDEEERKRYLRLIDICYWENIMGVALDGKNKSLMKKAYANLKSMGAGSLDAKILYYRLMHPRFVLFFRLIRKLKSLLRRPS